MHGIWFFVLSCWSGRLHLGIGASLGFPIAVSAAGSGEGDGAARVEAVSVIGYIAMLVGPPSLGFTGDAYGLRNAMVVVMLFVLAAAALSPGLQRR